MMGTTEIYICQPGQTLKQGQLVISHDVATREDAQADATTRCRLDKSIARIIYYAIRPDGDFRTLYSYENPNATAPRTQRPLVAGTRFSPPGKSRRRPKPTFFGRLRALFETD